MKVHQMTDFGRSLEDLAKPPALDAMPDAQYDEGCDLALESPVAISTRRRAVDFASRGQTTPVPPLRAMCMTRRRSRKKGFAFMSAGG